MEIGFQLMNPCFLLMQPINNNQWTFLLQENQKLFLPSQRCDSLQPLSSQLNYKRNYADN